MAKPMLRLLFAAALMSGVAACGSGNPLELTRSYCPGIGVAKFANSITLIAPDAAATAGALDLTGQLTAVSGVCERAGGKLVTSTRAVVSASRRDSGAEQTVELPVFVTLVRDNSSILSKQIVPVRLSFAAGARSASAPVALKVMLDEAAARAAAKPLTGSPDDEPLPPPGKKRRPRSGPTLESKVAPTAFEILWGFQLTNQQAAYNLAH